MDCVGPTDVVADAELSPRLMSLAAVSDAVLVMFPVVAGAVVAMVIVELPTASEGIVHVTVEVPPPLQLHPGAVIVPATMLPGSVSVTDSVVAGSGPPLVTVMV